MPGLLIGLALSITSGLGYSSDAYGLAVHARSEVIRVEARALEIAKADGGDGWALSGHGVVRVARWRALSLWAGADGSYQRVEAYASQAVGPRVDLELGRGPVRVGAYWVGDGGKVERVLGIRARAGRRASCVIELERVEHTEGSGRRAVISALWRL